MKKIILFIGSLLLFIYFTHDTSDQARIITLTDEDTELKVKYPIKSYHAKISLECIHCHEGQGNDPIKFTSVDDEKCQECHGDKRKVANRTAYMNTLFSNPHDSIHSESYQKLPCNDCHHAHEESENTCANCHPSRAFQWMREFSE